MPSECILLKGGGGADLDVITAKAEDILLNKVIVNAEGEPVAGTLELTGDAGTGDVVSGKGFYTTDPKTKSTGTLADKNGTTQSATPSLDTTNKRLQMTIPALGRYNTNSKLYAAFSAIASLIGLTAAKLVGGNTVLGVAGTALNDATISNANQVLKGVIAYGKNGVKYTGNIATYSGSTSITPSTSAQSFPTAGKYVGSNLTVAAVTKLYNVTGSATSSSGTRTFHDWYGDDVAYNYIEITIPSNVTVLGFTANQTDKIYNDRIATVSDGTCVMYKASTVQSLVNKCDSAIITTGKLYIPVGMASTKYSYEIFGKYTS